LTTHELVDEDDDVVVVKSIVKPSDSVTPSESSAPTSTPSSLNSADPSSPNSPSTELTNSNATPKLNSPIESSQSALQTSSTEALVHSSTEETPVELVPEPEPDISNPAATRLQLQFGGVKTAQRRFLKSNRIQVCCSFDLSCVMVVCLDSPIKWSFFFSLSFFF
jgi:hypothetical protein